VTPGPTAPPGLADLAARWLGASVVAASDESFGCKESLLDVEPARFDPGRYDHRGEIVDGWETRRRREGSHDWVIVRLGTPGRIAVIDVDTSNFAGNSPSACSIEALGAEGYPSVAALTAPHAEWLALAAPTELDGDAHNVIQVDDRRRFTHLRLSAYPDGGIARLRVYGVAIPDPRGWDGVTVELSGAEAGGRVVCASDEFYGSASTLIRPDRPLTMGDGWETARRRTGACDSVVIALAVAGRLRQVEIDTTHFKYNASAAFELWGTSDLPGDGPDGVIGLASWELLLPRTELQPDTRHRFAVDTPEVGTVRLDAYPDGGFARVRLLGAPTAAGRAAAERRWLESLPERQAAEVMASGVSR
jgi:allantoicase